MKFKYKVNPIGLLIQIGMLGLAYVLFFTRKKESLRFDFIYSRLPDFHTHVSNFSISYIIISGVGFLWLLLGIPFRIIIYFSLLIITINIIYELWIPILNTIDKVDAYYGIFGSLLAVVQLLFIYKCFLEPMEQEII